MAKKTAKDKPGRLKQISAAYSMTKQSDPKIGLVVAGVFLVVALLFGALGWWLLHPAVGVTLGLLTGLTAALIVFGRRAERAAYGQMEGQPGAAVAALRLLRRGWDVKPAVAATKNQDVGHRVVGRPGIVLVGEGDPNRARNLLTVEKKKHARVAGEAPIYEVVVGDGSAGTVPIRKLGRHVLKLPRNIRPGEVTDLMQRLKALDASRPQVPVPKGPMPQNVRAARSAARQMMRGR